MLSINQLLKKLREFPFVILSENLLDTILSSSSVIEEEEHDTLINGSIRIIEISGMIVFQELSNHNELILRRLTNTEEGTDLIKHRLDVYEKMWNGCGCKINFYD